MEAYKTGDVVIGKLSEFRKRPMGIVEHTGNKCRFLYTTGEHSEWFDDDKESDHFDIVTDEYILNFEYTEVIKKIIELHLDVMTEDALAELHRILKEYEYKD